jgi:hypothetical protein
MEDERWHISGLCAAGLSSLYHGAIEELSARYEAMHAGMQRYSQAFDALMKENARLREELHQARSRKTAKAK